MCSCGVLPYHPALRYSPLQAHISKHTVHSRLCATPGRPYIMGPPSHHIHHPVKLPPICEANLPMLGLDVHSCLHTFPRQPLYLCASRTRPGPPTPPPSKTSTGFGHLAAVYVRTVVLSNDDFSWLWFDMQCLLCQPNQ